MAQRHWRQPLRLLQRQRPSLAALAGHSTHSRCSGGKCSPPGEAAADDQPPRPKMEKPLAPPGLSRTFYKRQLPSPPSIEFASAKGGAAQGNAWHMQQLQLPDGPLPALPVTQASKYSRRPCWQAPWRASSSSSSSSGAAAGSGGGAAARLAAATATAPQSCRQSIHATNYHPPTLTNQPLLLPRHRLQHPGRAGLLRAGQPGHGAQHAVHRPAPHLEGPLALVPRGDAGLLPPAEQSAGGGDHAGAGAAARRAAPVSVFGFVTHARATAEGAPGCLNCSSGRHQKWGRHARVGAGRCPRRSRLNAGRRGSCVWGGHVTLLASFAAIWLRHLVCETHWC